MPCQAAEPIDRVFSPSNSVQPTSQSVSQLVSLVTRLIPSSESKAPRAPPSSNQRTSILSMPLGPKDVRRICDTERAARMLDCGGFVCVCVCVCGGGGGGGAGGEG